MPQRTHPRSLPALGLLALVLGAAACAVDAPELAPPAPEPAVYLPLTSPENLLKNLQVACRARNAARYAEILAPEFVFHLQPEYVPVFGKATLDQKEDSTGMARALSHFRVRAFRVDISYGVPVPDGRGNAPAGAMTIRAQPAVIEMDEFQDGEITTWATYEDIQEFYFRPANLAAGEDSARWFLFEWRDLPTSLATTGDRLEVNGPTPVRPFTWSELKTRYLDPPPAPVAPADR